MNPQVVLENASGNVSPLQRLVSQKFMWMDTAERLESIKVYTFVRILRNFERVKNKGPTTDRAFMSGVVMSPSNGVKVGCWVAKHPEENEKGQQRSMM